MEKGQAVNETERKRAIGLVSVASCEGVEASLLDTDGRDAIHPIGHVSLPYSERLRWRLLEVIQSDLPTTEILRLEREMTAAYVAAFNLLCREFGDAAREAEVIGFSGHTIRHIPSEGLTLQIGNPWQLAQGTGIPVVSDFRRHDMSNGGAGTPLEAMFYWAMMANEKRPSLLLHLGSVAKLVWLSETNEIIAGDTGPGVGLVDEWVQEMSNLPHDLEGKVAQAGTPDPALIESALAGPFFARPLPKGAGRDDFEHIDVSGLNAEDGAATLAHITIEAFIRAARRLPSLPDVLWVTGRGSRHALFCELLAKTFPQVKNVADRGLSPSAVQPNCYAWLAVRHLYRLPITTPETTGCRSADCGGTITRAAIETCI
ncbi:MAG: anhydro-N-acetylmuramic acid kinase [Planctomycetota bacterium]